MPSHEGDQDVLGTGKRIRTIGPDVNGTPAERAPAAITVSREELAAGRSRRPHRFDQMHGGALCRRRDQRRLGGGEV
jgi:hypothetical protein